MIYTPDMERAWRDWIRDVISWGKTFEKDADELAEIIDRGLREGVKPPPPDDTGTPLGRPPVDG